MNVISKAPRICAVGALKKKREVEIQLETLYKVFSGKGLKVLDVSWFSAKIARFFDVFIFLPLKHRQYDVIHVQAHSYKNFIFTIISLFWAKLLKKKLVVMFYSGNAHEFFRGYTSLVKFVFKQIDKVVVAGNYVKSAFDKMGIETTTIPHILPIDNWPYRHRTNIEPNLLWIRHFHKNYNPLMLLKIFERIKPVKPEAVLKIVGVGPMEDEMKDFVREHSLQDVHFLGRVSDAELRNLYNWGNIFINTTNVDNQPVTVIEAMTCGMAVVSTDAGGVPDIVTNEENGLLSPVGDVDAMSDNILRILNDDELLPKFSLNGRRYVENTFSPEDIYQKWSELYKQLGYEFP